jgi:hypothetical protein
MRIEHHASPRCRFRCQKSARQESVLEFDHYSQRYRVPCRITRLGEAEDAWQATYWHNLPFNPIIAAHSIVLGFMPDGERVLSGR